MKKRSESDQAALQKTIIDVAQTIIATHGLSGLTIRKIATQANCAVGMVYKAFNSMDDILIHVNAQTLDDLQTKMSTIVRQTSVIDQETLYTLACEYLAYHQKNPHFWQALFEYRYQDDVDIPDFYREKLGALFTLIEQTLKPILGKKTSPETIATTAQVLWAGVHGICTLSLHGSLKRIDRASDQALIKALITNHLASVSSY